MLRAPRDFFTEKSAKVCEKQRSPNLYPEVGTDDLKEIVQSAVWITLVWRLQGDSARDVRIQGAKMIVCLDECDYCRSAIFSGQRWVREKIYDPALNGRDPSYHHYHAEPFAGQEASCWEKHQMEIER